MSETTVQLHPIFNACCGEAGRYDFSKPFTIGKKVYASDGKICVRADRPFAMPETRGGVAPAADALGWPVVLIGVVSVALPDVQYGKKQCEKCNTTGIVTCNYEHEHKCPECGGEGEYEHFTAADVGVKEVGIATKYIALLRQHGVTHVYLIRPKTFYFTGDGFDGLVMACKLEKSSK